VHSTDARIALARRDRCAYPDPVRSAFVQANGIRIHHHRSGEGGVPIVLAHGFSDNGRCWASLVPRLERDHDVVAYDARGHGLSDAPDSSYSPDELADDLLGLVDALGLERPVLVGHSMGGSTVGWAALKRPDLPRALVFEDSAIPPAPPPAGPTAEQLDALRSGLVGWVRSLRRRSQGELMELARSENPRWPEADLEPWAESKLQLSEQALSAFGDRGRGGLGARLPKLPCPALFLKADAEGAERARQQAAVAALPGAHLVHVAGAGHNVRRDEHERTAALLREFLTRVYRAG
jgi:pimeloyl-ACP methyl ester carboxylesterase